MAVKYVFVRLPIKTYQLYAEIQKQMKQDIERYTGRTAKLPMTKVFKAIASHEFNEKPIQIDLHNLSKFARQRRSNGLF